MRRSIVIFVSFLIFTNILAQVNIWENTSVHKRVMITPYLENGEGNTAVIVCPGGSYFWHDMETEGIAVAEWLQKNGISAFVLKYRAAGKFAFVSHHRLLLRGKRYPDAQNDLRQAIKYVQSHAEEYGIDGSHIGVMGFSAGGHLVMSSGELFAPNDRPAFIVPVYPVVTLTEDCVHKRSRRALLGDNKKWNTALRQQLSLEKNVPTDCPPVFLVNCKDDPVVKYHNSELLDAALTEKGIPHVYIQYETGGHGFGASDTKGTVECRAWRDEFLLWLKQLKETWHE